MSETTSECASRGSPKELESKHEEDDSTGPEWKDDNVHKVFEAGSWCLNDHQEFWKNSGIKKELILNNPRLSKLRGEPKNKIVSLPDPDSVTLQFYCSNCSQIPLPWVPIPKSRISANESSTEAEEIYLCQRGHPICRACCNTLTRCVFDAVDFNYVFQKQKDRSILDNIPVSIEGSLGLWGQRRMCLAEFSSFQCMFLTSMITRTEFACKYYYNWCQFRGTGKQLQFHEDNCAFVTTLDSNGKRCLQDTKHKCQDIPEVNLGQQEKNSTVTGEEDGDEILTLHVSNICA